jgi:hypothetical protein
MSPPTLPALHARVSEVHGWIDKIVCELSAEPPEDFDCPSPVEESLDPEATCDTTASQNAIPEGCILGRCDGWDSTNKFTNSDKFAVSVFHANVIPTTE